MPTLDHSPIPMQHDPRQPVRLGRTQSGIPGLFTGGYLASSLTDYQYALFASDRAALVAHVERLGFRLSDD